MKPVRAKFGACDNSHKLLHCDNPDVSLPSELEGLTDRPAGSVTPGECWWPSIGCGPVGDWWGIWWTEPDTEAERGGMVKSEVALWPLSEIGKLEDLVPTLQALSNGTELQPAITEHIELVAAALLNGNMQPLVICNNLRVWPSILAALWRQLWSNARVAFSTRTVLIPPSGSTLSCTPKLLVIPKSREQQWQGEYTKVNLGNGLTTTGDVCRAARFFAGHEDDTVKEILKSIPPQSADFGYLRQVGRLAEKIDRLRQHDNFDDALGLLRTLQVAAPGSNTGIAYKTMGLSALAQTVENASQQQIEAMANLNLPELSEAKVLLDNLQKRIRALMPTLSSTESIGMVKKLLPGKAHPWWQSVLIGTLKSGIRHLDTVWSKLLLSWLIVPELQSITFKLIPGAVDIEPRLLSVVDEVSLIRTDINQLREQSCSHNWSIIHAWCLAKTLSPPQAFDAQFKFDGEIEPGLSYLARELPSKEVVKEAIRREYRVLINLAADFTVADPSLLENLNVSEHSSRVIWTVHIEKGGQYWSDTFTSAIKGMELLEAIISGQDSNGLLVPLAADLVDFVVDHPEREQLWARITDAETRTMLPLVAASIIYRVNTGQRVNEPERVVVDEIAMKVRSSKPSAQVFCQLISWGVHFEEHEVIRWIEQFTSSEWREAAPIVGKLAQLSKWRELAKKLYKLNKRKAEVKPAIEICHNILPPLDRLAYTFLDGGNSAGSHDQTNNMNELVNVVADIGSRLHPEGLDELWERAGGQRRNLESGGTPKDRWHHASRLAAQGSNKGGLQALVGELLNEYPNNSDLTQLVALLTMRMP